MKILIIDTCLGYLSVALASTKIIKEIKIPDLNQQSKLLAPLVSDLLKSTGNSISELDAILITRGPGSFTGIRIGLAFALGVHEITHCDLYTCSTLATLDKSYSGEVLATITAGADSYFTQRFVNHVATSDIEVMQKADISSVLSENSSAKPMKQFPEELELHRGFNVKIIGHYHDPTLRPNPSVILKLFQDNTSGIFTDDLTPLYIKTPYF